MSNDDNRTKPYQSTNVGGSVWSAKSAKSAMDSIRDEDQRYADLLDTLKQVRDQVAQKNPEFARSLGEEVGDYVVEAARADAVRKGQLKANIGGFEFSAVGSVDAAVHSIRPFDSGPTLDRISQAAPHDLAVLKEQAIAPERLGFDKPADFTDVEYGKVVSTYAGAELLDRERKYNETKAEREHVRERWKIWLAVVAPLATFILGVVAAKFGLSGTS